MWKKLIEAGLLFSRLSEKMQRLEADIKEIRTEHRAFAHSTEEKIRELREMIQRLAYEIQHDRENAAHEREKLELRLELRLRGLPLPPAAPDASSPALPSTGT